MYNTKVISKKNLEILKSLEQVDLETLIDALDIQL